MEKEKISRFDLEAAFKALDEIEIPKVKGIRPNRMDLTETVVRADRTSALIEDYYDLNDPEDVQEASEDRAAEIAKAKLARIEKIVDLDAESEDQIQPSYVGKTIIQCPQCMTLFYKDPADIELSEDDPSVVNVNEICQHCGNDTGYTLIGKVAEETPEEAQEEATPEEETAETEETTEEEVSEEEPAEETEEETSEEDLNLEPIEIPEEEEEEKNESLNASKLQKDSAKESELATEYKSENLTLNEDLNSDMDEYNQYIEYLQNQIEIEEKALKEATDNQLIKDAIQRWIDSLKKDLDEALPPVVKADDLPTPEEVNETEEDEKVKESLNASDFQKDSAKESELATENSSENLTLNEAVDKRLGKYQFVVYGTDNNANVLETIKGEDYVSSLKNIKKIRQDILDNNDKVEHVFVSKIITKDGKEDEVPMDELTISRHNLDYYYQDDVDEGLGSAVASVVDGVAGGIKSLLASDEAEKDEFKEAESKFNISKNEIDAMLNSEEFKKPISNAEVEGYLANESLEEATENDELDEVSFNEACSKRLKENFVNVNGFEATNCYIKDKNFIIEGLIELANGNKQNTAFTFTKVADNLYEGYNDFLSKDNIFEFKTNYNKDTKTVLTESFKRK